MITRVSLDVIVFMCLQSSPLYQCMYFPNLSERISLYAIRNDQETDPAVPEYPCFLLKVGEGKLKQTIDSFIELPPSIYIAESLAKLVESILPNLKEKYDDVQ